MLHVACCMLHVAATRAGGLVTSRAWPTEAADGRGKSAIFFDKSFGLIYFGHNSTLVHVACCMLHVAA